MAKVSKLPTADIALMGGKTPTYASTSSVGADLYSINELVVMPGWRAEVPLGIAIAIPEGYAGMILPRSGWAKDTGITILNSPGLIDPDYRGEWKAIVVNHGSTPVRINVGDRVAQLIIVPYVKVNFNLVEALDVTERGEGGFGSSGR